MLRIPIRKPIENRDPKLNSEPHPIGNSIAGECAMHRRRRALLLPLTPLIFKKKKTTYQEVKIFMSLQRRPWRRVLLTVPVLIQNKQVFPPLFFFFFFQYKRERKRQHRHQYWIPPAKLAFCPTSLCSPCKVSGKMPASFSCAHCHAEFISELLRNQHSVNTHPSITFSSNPAAAVPQQQPVASGQYQSWQAHTTTTFQTPLSTAAFTSTSGPSPKNRHRRLFTFLSVQN